MKSSKSNGKYSLRPAAAMIAVVCATPFFLNSAQSADWSDKPRRELVQFADLNLSSSDGAAALYRRIHVAAVRVCGAGDSHNLVLAAAVRPCIDHAVAEALVAVNNPVVTDRYLAKTKRADLRLADTRTR